MAADGARYEYIAVVLCTCFNYKLPSGSSSRRRRRRRTPEEKCRFISDSRKKRIVLSIIIAGILE